MICAKEFFEKLLEAVNERVGFEILKPADYHFTEQELDAMRGSVEWKNARDSMEASFNHLKEDHGVACQVDLPSESGSTYKSCARKLCAVAASSYAPQFPTKEEWLGDKKLRELLRCGVGHFLFHMVRPSDEKEGESSDVKVVTLPELWNALLPEDVKTKLAETVLAASVLMKMIQSPQAFLAIANAAEEFPTEAAQSAFLNRATQAFAKYEGMPDSNELATIIRCARENKQSKPN